MRRRGELNRLPCQVRRPRIEMRLRVSADGLRLAMGLYREILDAIYRPHCALYAISRLLAY